VLYAPLPVAWAVRVRVDLGYLYPVSASSYPRPPALLFLKAMLFRWPSSLYLQAMAFSPPVSDFALGLLLF